MNFDQLRKLIAQDNTYEVIRQLEAWALENHRHDIIDQLALQQARLRELEEQKLQHTASNQELEIAAAKIRRSLLDILNQAASDKKTPFGKRRKPKTLVPILVGIISLGLLVAGFIKMPTVNLGINARVDYLQFRLLEDRNIDFDLFLNQFEAFNLKAADGLSRSFVANESEPINLTAAGDSIKLDQLELQANDRIAFTVAESELQLNLVEGEIENGKLEFNQADVFIDPIGWDTSISISSNLPPEIFTFNSAHAPEFRLLFCPNCPISFERLAVDELSFAYEKSISESVLTSSIIGGKVSFGQIQDTLAEREYLSIRELENGLLSFHKEGAFLIFQLEGQAKDIRVGYAGQVKSLKPNLLQHLYHNNRNVFYFVLSIWLIGVLWVVKKLFIDFR